ncbi:MAG: sigma-70 family RNA polymerase sigma factor [Planctomycetes bacterium]|nr:sigma-70 family RNA polymerase sigma factor [Planctomycetota bacterium]
MTAILEEITSATSSTEIRDLVLAAQNGDRTAFGELFKRFESSVFAVCLRRLEDFAEAEELCQDVFIQALNKLDQLRKPECIGGWLRSIAERMAINRAVRRRAVTLVEAESLNETCVETETPLDTVLTRERHSHLRAGLARLGDLDRATLVAFYVLGNSLNEMSKAFNAPIGTIKRRLHVARKRLAEEVDGANCV